MRLRTSTRLLSTLSRPQKLFMAGVQELRSIQAYLNRPVTVNDKTASVGDLNRAVTEFEHYAS